MFTPNQQPSPPSGGASSRKRRRSSSLSSSSSSDVVIILDDHDIAETEPSKPAPPQQSKPTVTSGKSGDASNNQGDDESNILEELRRARDVLQRHRNQGTADATSGGTTHVTTNEKEIEYIPGLVNRVMAESNREGGMKRSVVVTELLVELVLGFVEPYVMQLSQERITGGRNNKKQGYNNNDDRFLSMTSDADSTEYRDRAIAWAVHRIKDLLRPVDVELGTDIPELDALLSALGRYDGLAHERNIQQQLREVLLGMTPTSMHSDAKESEGLGAVDVSKNNGALYKTAKDSGGDGGGPTPSPTSVAECWSVSPEKWMDKVTKSTVAEDSNAEETESMDEAMESFPYLRQMKDFLMKRIEQR